MAYREMDSLPDNAYSTKLRAEFNSFLAGGSKYAEISTAGYKNPRSCYAAYKKALKTHAKEASIGVIMRGGKIYLVNKLKEAKND